jgi:hypothetical protein
VNGSQISQPCRHRRIHGCVDRRHYPDVGAAGLFVCIVALLLSLGAYLRWDRSPFSETPISINVSGAVERAISRGDNERALRFVRQQDSIINALQGTVFNLGQELRMYARLQLMLWLGAAGLFVVARVAAVRAKRRVAL